MTWVALSELARPSARERIIAERRAFLESELSREHDTLADLRALPPSAEGARVAILMVDHVIEQLRLELGLMDGLTNLFSEPPDG